MSISAKASGIPDEDPNKPFYLELIDLKNRMRVSVDKGGKPREAMAYGKALPKIQQWARDKWNPSGVLDFTKHLAFTEADADEMQKAKIGVGKGIHKKIVQFVKTNKISSLEDLREAERKGGAAATDELLASKGYGTMSSEQKVVKELAEIKYIGPSIAGKLRDQLDLVNPDTAVAELQEAISYLGQSDIDAFLPHNSQLGLRHHDELMKRMPRAQVERYGETVYHIIETAYGPPSNESWELEIGGSFFRGELESGDLDIVLLVPNGLFTLRSVVRLLKRYGFVFESFTGKDQSKFLGLGRCSTNPERVFSVDILFATNPKEFQFQLLHYTLGKERNTDLRERAKRGGYKLNEKGLWDLFDNRIQLPPGDQEDLLERVENEIKEKAPSQRMAFSFMDTLRRLASSYAI